LYAPVSGLATRFESVALSLNGMTRVVGSRL